MFLDTCLSILDVAQKATEVAGKATRLFDWFTGVSAGEHMNSTVNQLAGNNSRVERLSDRIWYAPNLQQAINKEGNKQLQNNQQIFDLINPIAEALGTDVLASAVISTPDKLKQAFKKDPWELLIEVRPANRTKKPVNPDLIPIAFLDGGMQYIGWQTRGALPSLFNCDFEYNGNLYVPSNQFPVPDKQTIGVQETEDDIQRERFEALKNELYDWFDSHAHKEGFYVHPAIPDSKLSRAAEQFTIDYEEEIIALVDFTIFGSASDFLAFGFQGIYYHNAWAAEQSGFHFISYIEFPHRIFSQTKTIPDYVSLDKGDSLWCVGSDLKQKDIVVILNGVKHIVGKYLA